MIFAAAASSLSSSDRALMAACRVIAAETGENSCALYSARKSGFVSVAAHTAAKRAAAEEKATAERFARNAIRSAESCIRTPEKQVIFVALSESHHNDDRGPVMLPATLASIARREELRAVDPTNSCAADVYYVRAMNGRVSRW